MMDYNFPPELLNSPIKDRLEYFDNYIVGHPLLKKATEETINAIRNSGEESIIFVYGPSGVGKKVLIQKIVELINNDQSFKDEKFRSHIPVLSIRLIASDQGNHNWKDYYRRILIALEEPMIDKKIEYCEYVTKNKSGDLIVKTSARSSDLRLSVENALKYRGVSTLIVDEAQHLTKMASGRKLKDQLDVIKSLANESKTLHVLVGTYELQSFLNLSGQLSRRTTVIHFPRYRVNVKGDIEAFVSVLNQFLVYLPIEKDILDLLNNWKFFYRRTIGCIGILKIWLRRSMVTALDRGSNSLTLEDLGKNVLSLSQAENMLIESLEGEKSSIEISGSAERLDSLLGIDKAQENKKNSVANVALNSKKRVGERNPVRDKVGKDEFSSTGEA